MQTIELRINEGLVGLVTVVSAGPAPDMGLQRNVYRYEWEVVFDRARYGKLASKRGILDHPRHEGPFALTARVMQAALHE